jgi:hypothetical protein
VEGGWEEFVLLKGKVEIININVWKETQKIHNRPIRDLLYCNVAGSNRNSHYLVIIFLSNYVQPLPISSSPNMKLFTTQCRLHSSQHAVCHGVSVLRFPSSGDQQYKAKGTATVRIGLHLSCGEMTKGKLLTV